MNNMFEKTNVIMQAAAYRLSVKPKRQQPKPKNVQPQSKVIRFVSLWEELYNSLCGLGKPAKHKRR